MLKAYNTRVCKKEPPRNKAKGKDTPPFRAIGCADKRIGSCVNWESVVISTLVITSNYANTSMSCNHRFR
jgi:hypothetical protein